jgi:ferredoxin-NADP reductase
MKLKLISVRDEFTEIKSFIFKSEFPITWKAGQYIRYHIDNPNSDDRGQNRFFTIASAPFEQYIQITTRISQKSSTFKSDLTNLEIGQSIEGTEPNGKFILDGERSYVFIAGGIGITPFRSMIVDLNHRNLPININLLYANKTSEIVFQKELDEIATSHPEFKINYFVGENKISGYTLKTLISRLNQPFFYISGPEEMMKSFVEKLIDLGLPQEQIRHDFFPGYNSF